jgi:hypothetical protein
MLPSWAAILVSNNANPMTNTTGVSPTPVIKK